MKRSKWLFIAMAIMGIAVAGCNKEKSMHGSMTVKMTDAPATFLEVNVEIIEFQVHYAGGSWVSLPMNAGVYDLLTLQNDITATLVSDADLQIGKITQVRLVLGNNNSVVTPDGVFPLTIPSGEESGIKINVNSEIVANQNLEILLDFDAGSSVVIEGNGSFSLKPVIKVESIVQS